MNTKTIEAKDSFSFASNVASKVNLKCDGIAKFPENITLEINGETVNLEKVTKIGFVIDAGFIPRLVIEYYA